MLTNITTPLLTPEEKMQKALSSLIEETDLLETAADLADVLANDDITKQQRWHLTDLMQFLHSVARVQLDPESRKKHEAAA